VTDYTYLNGLRICQAIKVPTGPASVNFVDCH